MTVQTYTVEGMTCGHCAASVTREVSAAPGVTDATVDLDAKIGFSRDGRSFVMKVKLQGAVGSLGATPIAAPPEGEVVATPGRLREVDDRDYLLQGIAPPIRKNPDGTAVTPAKPADKPGDRK